MSRTAKAVPMCATKAPSHAKPVQLQLNNSGSWKTIVSFDAASEAASGSVMAAAQSLQAIDAKAKFRIATRDALPIVLMYLDNGDWRTN